MKRALVLIIAVVLASQAGTQVVAWQARYHTALGPPVVRLTWAGQAHALYRPWQGYAWAWQWGRRHPAPFRMAGIVSLLVLLVGILPLRQAAGTLRGSHPPPATGHGTATWATRQEVRAAGLQAPQGLVMGTHKGHVLRFNGPENVLLVGPQRQGKGVGVIIPTLLEIPGHVLVIDVRGETWASTAGWRSTFSRCLRLSVTQPGSIRFNLLEAVRTRTPSEFMDAALLGDMMVDPGGNKADRDHWEKTAKALITCGILYEVRRNPRPSLGAMASFWSTPGRSMEATLRQVVETAPTRPCAELAQEVLNKAANEASGVLSSMMTQLFIFRDPTIAANTSRSDVTLEDFTRHDRWTSLYLVLSPGEEEHVRPFMRMFLRLALQRWLEMGETKHRITLLMDEFTSWGRIPFFAQNLAVLGGRGIRTLIAVQNLPQLTETYGKADVITEQCKVRIFFAANGQVTGEEISRQAGVGTAVTEQISSRRDWFSVADGSSSVTQHAHARPLLTAAEAMQIPQDHAVIQVAGHPPVWAKKVRFWEQQPWKTRAHIPAPSSPPSPP